MENLLHLLTKIGKRRNHLNSLRVMCILANELQKKETAMGFRNGVMELFIKATGKMIKCVAMESLSILIKINMKESGKITWLMVLELTLAKQEQNMLGSGRTINIMEKDTKLELTSLLIRDNTLSVRSMEKVPTDILKALSIQESFI